MQDPRSSYNQTNAGSASKVAICACSIASGLFVSKGYEADTKIDGFVCSLYDRNPDEPENDTHSEITKGLSNDLGSCSSHGHCLRHYVMLEVSRLM